MSGDKKLGSWRVFTSQHMSHNGSLCSRKRTQSVNVRGYVARSMQVGNHRLKISGGWVVSPLLVLISNPSSLP